MDDSDQQAEYDAMLIEYAGDILPSLASAIGGAAFAPYFAGFLPLLLKKTVSQQLAPILINVFFFQKYPFK